MTYRALNKSGELLKDRDGCEVVRTGGNAFRVCVEACRKAGGGTVESDAGKWHVSPDGSYEPV